MLRTGGGMDGRSPAIASLMDQSMPTLTPQAYSRASSSSQRPHQNRANLLDKDRDAANILVQQFRSLKDQYRHLKWILPVSVIAFATLLCVVNFSPWSPLRASKDNISFLFSLHFIWFALVQFIAVAFLWRGLISRVFSVTYGAYLNVGKVENWIATACIFAFNVASTILLVGCKPDGSATGAMWFASKTYATLWLICTVLSSFASGFTSDFAYYFPVSNRQHASKAGRRGQHQQQSHHPPQISIAQFFTECIARLQLLFTAPERALSMVVNNAQSQLPGPAWLFPTLRHQLARSAWIVCDGWALTLFLNVALGSAVGSSRFAAIKQLLLFYRLVDFFALVFFQQVMVTTVVWSVNRSLMGKMIAFPLPSTYFSNEGSRNFFSLPAALNSDDPEIRIFALYYLRWLCGRAETRRQLYELSQPGHHPRNWHAIKSAATYFINGVIRTKLDEARLSKEAKEKSFAAMGTKMAGTSFNDSRFEEADGLSPSSQSRIQRLLLPPTLCPRTDLFARDGFDLASGKLGWFRLPEVVVRLLNQLCASLLVPAPVISTYEATCAIYAYEAVQIVLAECEEEDTYGVVASHPIELDPRAVSFLRRVVQVGEERRNGNRGATHGHSAIIGSQQGAQNPTGLEKLVTEEDIHTVLDEMI